MSKKKSRNPALDALKEFKKNSREEEIRNFGHPISYSRVFRNRKKFNRKKKHRQEEETQ